MDKSSRVESGYGLWFSVAAVVSEHRPQDVAATALLCDDRLDMAPVQVAGAAAESPGTTGPDLVVLP